MRAILVGTTAVVAGAAILLVGLGCSSGTKEIDSIPSSARDAGDSSPLPGRDGGDASEAASTDPLLSQVVLLLHMTGPSGSKDFQDASGRHPATSVGNAAISPDQSKFGGGSLRLDGSSYLTLPSSPDWDLTATDCTIELWVFPELYTTCSPPNFPGHCEQTILSQSPGTSDGNWVLGLIDKEPYGVWGARSGGAETVTSGISTLSTMWNKWNHVAFSKTKEITSVFVNGSKVASRTANPFDGTPNALYVGASATDTLGNNMSFHGYMNELRITRGVARYTGDFTPPNAPFPSPTVVATPPSPPPSDSWAKLDQTSTPGQQGYHSMIWTGSKMILWGGNVGSMKDGWSYDPATRAWSKISSSGAPSPRFAHSAVWTGDKMIVWGGAGASPMPEVDGPSLNDGAAYDPATDSWTSISKTGAPAARHVHSAVWTGTKMLIWGGTAADDRQTAMNDGAAYDPGTDKWTPISSTNAPSARQGHAAVWTGTKMLVWGGIAAGIGCVNDGAAYDLQTGQWSPLSFANPAATARYLFASSWTGTELLVWSGVSPSGTPLSDGFAFNPTTAAWRGLSTTNQPTARYAASATWTGSGMVVWGGIVPQVSVFDNGSTYFP